MGKKTIATLIGEELEPILWKNVNDGMIVYLYATHEGKEYDGCGPFRVINANKRTLTRCDSHRQFFHYPEELYRLTGKIKLIGDL